MYLFNTSHVLSLGCTASLVCFMHTLNSFFAVYFSSVLLYIYTYTYNATFHSQISVHKDTWRHDLRFKLLELVILPHSNYGSLLTLCMSFGSFVSFCCLHFKYPFIHSSGIPLTPIPQTFLSTTLVSTVLTVSLIWLISYINTLFVAELFTFLQTHAYPKTQSNAILLINHDPGPWHFEQWSQLLVPVLI